MNVNAHAEHKQIQTKFIIIQIIWKIHRQTSQLSVIFCFFFLIWIILVVLVSNVKDIHFESVDASPVTQSWRCCHPQSPWWSLQSDWVYRAGVITAVPNGIYHRLLIRSLAFILVSKCSWCRVQRTATLLVFTLVNSVFLLRRRSGHFPSVSLCCVTAPPLQRHSMKFHSSPWAFY